MLSGANKPFMPSVFVLNVVMLSVVMLNVMATLIFASKARRVTATHTRAYPSMSTCDPLGLTCKY